MREVLGTGGDIAFMHVCSELGCPRILRVRALVLVGSVPLSAQRSCYSLLLGAELTSGMCENGVVSRVILAGTLTRIW